VARQPSRPNSNGFIPSIQEADKLRRRFVETVAECQHSVDDNAIDGDKTDWNNVSEQKMVTFTNSWCCLLEIQVAIQYNSRLFLKPFHVLGKQYKFD